MVSGGELIARAPRWRKRIVVSLAFGLFLQTASADLSLTPRRQEYELEGVKKWRLVFETGTPVEAKFKPPEGWEFSGSSKTLTLRPPGKPNAEASVALLAFEDFPPCNESGGRKLVEFALGSVPEGSLEVKVESEAASPIQIAGKETYLVRLSYTFYGEHFSRYCLYLVSNSGPMRCQLTCRRDDFEALSQAFQKSLITWQSI